MKQQYITPCGQTMTAIMVTNMLNLMMPGNDDVVRIFIPPGHTSRVRRVLRRKTFRAIANVADEFY